MALRRAIFAWNFPELGELGQVTLGFPSDRTHGSSSSPHSQAKVATTGRILGKLTGAESEVVSILCMAHTFARHALPVGMERGGQQTMQGKVERHGMAFK